MPQSVWKLLLENLCSKLPVVSLYAQFTTESHNSWSSHHFLVCLLLASICKLPLVLGLLMDSFVLLYVSVTFILKVLKGSIQDSGSALFDSLGARHVLTQVVQHCQ